MPRTIRHSRMGTLMYLQSHHRAAAGRGSNKTKVLSCAKRSSDAACTRLHSEPCGRNAESKSSTQRCPTLCGTAASSTFWPFGLKQLPHAKKSRGRRHLHDDARDRAVVVLLPMLQERHQDPRAVQRVARDAPGAVVWAHANMSIFVKTAAGFAGVRASAGEQLRQATTLVAARSSILHKPFCCFTRRRAAPRRAPQSQSRTPRAVRTD